MMLKTTGHVKPKPVVPKIDQYWSWWSLWSWSAWYMVQSCVHVLYIYIYIIIMNTDIHMTCIWSRLASGNPMQSLPSSWWPKCHTSDDTIPPERLRCRSKLHPSVPTKLLPMWGPYAHPFISHQPGSVKLGSPTWLRRWWILLRRSAASWPKTAARSPQRNNIEALQSRKNGELFWGLFEG